MTKADEISNPLLIYLDETGDHSLEKIDKDFPLFVLTTFLVRQSVYTNEIIPTVYKIKIENFGHEGIILHSRDIRKAQPPFEFLQNTKKRGPFLEAISQLIGNLNFKLIVSVIKKERLVEVYSKPYNPYELALKFNMERIVILLKKINQTKVRLVAESRGENEDNSLRLAFYKILRDGTERISKEEFMKIDFILTFLPKSYNIIGTQIADLCGYPIGRHILNPEKENKPFEVIKPKILGEVDGWDCFKVFP
jgi:hypothetical protein